MSNTDQDDISDNAKALGEHASRIHEQYEYHIVTWSFLLNTGGLVAIFSFLGITGEEAPKLFIIPLLTFPLGLLLCVISAFIEQHRFTLKGKNYEKNRKLWNEKNGDYIDWWETTYNEYANTGQGLRTSVKYFTIGSYFLFFIGLFVGIGSLLIYI